MRVSHYGGVDSQDDPAAAVAACTDPETLVQLGEDLERLDRYDDAAVAFRRAVELGSPARRHVGYALQNAGRPAEAADAFLEAALAGEPGAWSELGDLRDWWLHDVPGAREAYSRAAVSGDMEGLVQLAFLDRLDGDTAKARIGMERAATLGSAQAKGALACWDWDVSRDVCLEPRLREGADHYAYARAALAQLLRTTGRANEARDLRERAIAAGEVEQWLPLGNIYVDEMGDQEAAEAAEAAYRSGISEGDSWCHYNLAKLLLDRGDTAEAREHLKAGSEAGDHKAKAALTRLDHARPRPRGAAED